MNTPHDGTRPHPPATHGLGHERVEPDWAPLTTEEVADVLGGPAQLRRHSPRPLSAAAIVEHDGRRVFLKRHHSSVRTLAGLEEEHAFLRHLRSRGAPVVDVLAGTARGEWTYEVHSLGTGTDLYGDALSWTPFLSTHHAREAGSALARLRSRPPPLSPASALARLHRAALHRAALGHHAPARRAQPLVSSFRVFRAPDPRAALADYLAERPALAELLRTHPLDADLARWHLHLHAELIPVLPDLEPLWTHNDWHASNLLWDTSGGADTVSTVLDFNLSDRTTAVHDLAVALERNVFGRLDLPHGHVPVHYDHMTALLEGYAAVRPLTDAEAEALPALLPLVNAEYALSEMHYFHDVTHSAASTELARAYFTDHTRWFTTEPGHLALRHLRNITPTLPRR